MQKSHRHKPQIPLFISKLLDMLEDPECRNQINWMEDGDGFIIYKLTSFTQTVLPKYFKHQNISSFIRQLNMYGFAKSKREENENIYSNPFFQRGNKADLKKIQRKAQKEETENDESSAYEKPGVQQTEMQQLHELKKKQNQLERKFTALIQANKNLLNQNAFLMKNIKKQERKRDQFLHEFQMILASSAVCQSKRKKGKVAQSDSSSTGEIQNNAQPEDNSQQSFQQFDVPQVKNSLLDDDVSIVSFNDFINLPQDSCSQGFHFQ